MERLPHEIISDKELKWSYWYVTHKLIILKYTKNFLIGLNIVFVILFVYKVIDIFVLRQKLYELSVTKLVSSTGILGAMVPTGDVAVVEPEVINVKALLSNSNKVDFYAQIGNSNSKYAGYFEYRFVASDFSTKWKSSFILPEQVKYFHELGYETDTSAYDFSNVNLEIRFLKWKKVLEYQSLLNERLKIVFNEVEHILESGSLKNNDLVSEKIRFKVSNESSYSFRQVSFFVVAYNGSIIDSVNKIKLDKIDANSFYFVDVPWKSNANIINKIEIFPEIDILNEKVYKKPS